MLRTYNYTGRTDLDKKDIIVETFGDAFSVKLKNIESLPKNCEISLIVKHRLLSTKFNDGTVKKKLEEKEPIKHNLKDFFDILENFKMDILIVNSENQILSRTNDIPIKIIETEEEVNKGILPIKISTDLVNPPYKVSVDDREIKLEVSYKCSILKEKLNDRETNEFNLIMPAIIRDALTIFYFNSNLSDKNYDKWSQFIKDISDDNKYLTTENTEQKFEYIEDLTQIICEKHNFSKYIK